MAGSPNLARFQFLDPASRDFYPDWDLFAEMCVGVMRAEAGRDPHDRGLQDLIGELSTRSDTFRRLWADHNVRTHGTGTKRFNHPIVGELTLAYEELAITAEPGLVLLIYTAEPAPPPPNDSSCSRPGRHRLSHAGRLSYGLHPAGPSSRALAIPPLIAAAARTTAHRYAARPCPRRGLQPPQTPGRQEVSGNFTPVLAWQR